MRTKRTIINFIAAIFLQVATGVCGLIVPRVFIAAYGSDVNGMIASINQFLSYITFFEAGLSGIVLSKLYKPIAENDYVACNKILSDARNFFAKISIAYLVYVVALMLVYPHIVLSNKSKIYISTLILILSVNLSFQYLFGIVNYMFIQAKQEGYIYSLLQSVVVILNMAVVIICTKSGTTVHFLKFISVFIASISPIGLLFYVKIKYRDINIFSGGDSKNIKQRWDGIIHHVCYYIQTNIDIMILTLVDLKLVSVYSIYSMIILTIRKVFETFLTSFRSAIGDLFARDENDRVLQIFSLLEYMIYTLTVIVFVSLAFSIVPFIRFYTSNITDMNYINIPFAIMMLIGEVCYTIRIPYHIMVNCTGCFKQTKYMALQEAIINILVSSIFVFKYGIIGVAAGTTISCLYRTIRYYMFFCKNILFLSSNKIIKRIAIMILEIVVCIGVFIFLDFKSENLVSWLTHGIIYFLISGIISIAISSIAFKEDFYLMVSKLKEVIN